MSIERELLCAAVDRLAALVDRYPHDWPMSEAQTEALREQAEDMEAEIRHLMGDPVPSANMPAGAMRYINDVVRRAAR